MSEYFKCLSVEQIRRVINKLEKDGVIIKGNLKNAQHNNTNWYAFKDEELFLQDLDIDNQCK